MRRHIAEAIRAEVTGSDLRGVCQVLSREVVRNHFQCAASLNLLGVMQIKSGDLRSARESLTLADNLVTNEARAGQTDDQLFKVVGMMNDLAVLDLAFGRPTEACDRLRRARYHAEVRVSFIW